MITTGARTFGESRRMAPYRTSDWWFWVERAPSIRRLSGKAGDESRSSQSIVRSSASTRRHDPFHARGGVRRSNLLERRAGTGDTCEDYSFGGAARQRQEYPGSGSG